MHNHHPIEQKSIQVIKDISVIVNLFVIVMSSQAIIQNCTVLNEHAICIMGELSCSELINMSQTYLSVNC